MARRKPKKTCPRCLELEAENKQLRSQLQQMREYYDKFGLSTARLVGDLLNRQDKGGRERRRRVFQLRAEGKRRQEIADELGITIERVDAILYNKNGPKPPPPSIFLNKDAPPKPD